MRRKVKVIIIGAGSAGLSALDEVAKETDDYLLVNDGPLGTSCARVACMPTKTLIEAANAFYCRSRFLQRGIHGGDKLNVSIPEVMTYVRRLRDYFVSGMVEYTKKLGDKCIDGRARFVSPTSLEVNGKVLEGERIIIATGSRPIVPEKWLMHKKFLVTSDDFFEQRDFPSSIAVVGLGPAGLELAQALSRLGVSVHGIEATKVIGALSDTLVSDAAMKAISAEFPIHLETEAALLQVEGGEGIDIIIGGTRLRVGKILLTMGRRNLEDLGLENIGVDVNDHGIPIYNPGSMQIGDMPVFIAGDANAQLAILHEAIDEGLIAGFNAVRQKSHCFQRRTPLAICFTEPNLAVAGRGFSELTGEDVVIGEYDFAKQSRALMSDRNKGMIRVYVARSDARLLGAEMAAPDGEHLAHLLAWCIQQKLNIYQILRFPFYHPVVEEGMRSACRRAAEQLEEEFTIEHLLCGSAPPQCLC
jgi:dihydrolipoamide dehydrogenase